MGQTSDSDSAPNSTLLPKPDAAGHRPTHYVGRFAPSPTGPLHFGSLIAAVGSFLQARTAQGDWLVRIEDIDQPRVVPGAADDILRTLDAFGFAWQGPVEYQSRRLEHYAAAIEQLRVRNLIYRCTCSRSQIATLNLPAELPTEQVDELRYVGICRQRLTTPNEPAALRFVVTEGVIQFVDCVQGPQVQNIATTCGDFVVRRRDGYYAYHLAVVVDDAAQGVTEVVRGSDLLSSTARQILLQQALNLTTPAYCHLPLAIDNAGRKLSKSSQSRPINPQHASLLLWLALEALQQMPPPELREAPLAEIWDWSQVHWSLDPLASRTHCPAPEPNAKVC